MDEDQTRSPVQRLSSGPDRSTGATAVPWGSVELNAELSEWLKLLPARHLATVAFYLDLLTAQGPRLRWPYVRQVDAKLHKLRFHLDGRAVRIFFWFAPGRRIVLLTVFMKGRMRDQREISRARGALKHCQVAARGAPKDSAQTTRQDRGGQEQNGG